MAGAAQSGKGRKIGRNKKWCERYRQARRREKNKALRLRKHLGRFAGDTVAMAALKVCQAVI